VRLAGQQLGAHGVAARAVFGEQPRRRAVQAVALGGGEVVEHGGGDDRMREARCLRGEQAGRAQRVADRRELSHGDPGQRRDARRVRVASGTRARAARGDARRISQLACSATPRGAVEQHGLAESRGSLEHDHAAAAGGEAGDRIGERDQLGRALEQRRLDAAAVGLRRLARGWLCIWAGDDH
jgi:hypothetical protein